MSIELWWFDGLKADLLFAGCLETPVAEVERSNKGKKWRAYTDLPGINLPKTYLDRFEARKMIEPLIRNWFDMAATTRPATDTDHE